MIATFPVGGVAWDYGQYALGLERLGFDVYYLEDTGIPSYSYDLSIRGYVEDPRDGVAFLREALRTLSPSLAERWHLRTIDGQTFGISEAELSDVIAESELLLNVSGGCLMRETYRRARRRVLIDTDPGWNHFVVFPRCDTWSAERRAEGYRAHDYYFTYALRLGRSGCPLPTFGIEWQSTLPPVVLDCWRPRPPATRWTTVMRWMNYLEPVTYDGITYGAKECEFGRVEDLPRHVASEHELAVNSPDERFPRQRWQAAGWSVVDGREQSRTSELYRAYVEGSRGEFSVAKNVYVATHSGWFSCRSTCYLAAGRPIVVQDTGFSELLPIGEGLLVFSELSEAISAIEAIESRYRHHQVAAKEVACEIFDSKLVISSMLARIGM